MGGLMRASTRHGGQSEPVGPAGRRRRWAGFSRAAALVALLAPGSAGAEEAAPPPRSIPQVGLDQLLKLPTRTSISAAARPVGGASRSEWRARHTDAQRALEEAQGSLEKAQSELQEIAGSTDNWQIAAPGGVGASNDGPLSYRLRRQIKRSREEIERAERKLRDVKIEAELAGVPPTWLTESEAR